MCYEARSVDDMVFLSEENEVVLQCDMCKKSVTALNRFGDASLCIDCMMNVIEASVPSGESEGEDTSEGVNDRAG